MSAVKLADLTLYAIAVYCVVEIAFGCADEYLHAFDVIGQEPHQADGENRNLPVTLREEPVYQLTATQTLIL